MKSGREIIPEENYRLKAEDIYIVSPKKGGTTSSGSVKSDSSASTVDSTHGSDGMMENFPDIGREASTTVYAKAGDKKVTL
jgi:hypothetical protein